MPLDVSDLTKYARSRDGKAFIAYTALNSSGTGLNAQIQFWNPPTSGKNALLYSYVPFSGTSTTFGFVAGLSTTALAGAAMNGNNKLSGGAASSVQLIGLAATTAFPTVIEFYAKYIANVIVLPPEFRFDDPIILPPGNGITIQSDTINVHMAGTFQWEEI